MYRLRNYKDLESLIEELSALYPKKTLLELYNYATDKPHSFLYINLVAKDKRKMFMENLDRIFLLKWISIFTEQTFSKVIAINVFNK